MFKYLKEPTWRTLLESEFQQPYLKKLTTVLLEEQEKGQVVYPVLPNVFAALNATAFDRVKVVIVGQDPYHGEGQAEGLSFSVPNDVRLPPSLRNIFKELYSDLGVQRTQGCLRSWAEQGVLLLNSVLTVTQGQPGAHQGLGWELFTDKIIQLLSQRAEPMVFILWGSYAQAKGAHIPLDKHLVLSAPHPSPLSAYRGFFGSKPFSAIQQFLLKQGVTPIQWGDPV